MNCPIKPGKIGDALWIGECGAPAMLDRSWRARGVDFDGGDIIVEMGRMRCVRGHTWDQIIETLPDVSDRIPDGLHLES